MSHNKTDSENNDRGVSPVIGVILMVAVTVVLAAVIGTFVLDLSENQEEPAQAGVSIDQTNNGINITWNNNQNAEQINILVNGTQEATLNSVGDSATIAVSSGDEISIVGVTADGNETILRTYNADTAVGSVYSGTVSYNPPAEGVEVVGVDGSGNVVETDVTDKNGQFSISNNNAEEIRIDGVTVATSESSGISVDVQTVADANSTTIPDVLMNGSGTSSDPYQIENASDLQAMQEDLDGNYVITNDVDASHTKDWNGGSGFSPVGTSSNPFNGNLDGNNNSVNNIYMNYPSTDYVGLIGYNGGSSTQTISDLSVTNADVTGGSNVGIVVGVTDDTDLTNVSATGTVNGTSTVGGLVGWNFNGTISNSSADIDVTGSNKFTGGLVGYANNSSTISNSTVSGTVNGDYRTGGFVGMNEGTINNSSASTSVDGASHTGGFAGVNNNVIDQSYATGDVTSSGDQVGGFIGINYGVDSSNIGKVTDSYSTGSVSGNNVVGGFMGENDSGDVINVYSTGTVSASASTPVTGGILGEINDSNSQGAELTDSYWDTESTGQSAAVGNTDTSTGTVSKSGNQGFTTSEMQGSSAETNMSGFDWTNIWTTTSSYPELQNTA